MDYEEFPEKGLSVHQFTDQTSNVVYRIIFCLPMILGNILMICVTSCNRQLRQTPKHVIIVSQSLCGVISGVILMPLTIEVFLENTFLHRCSVYLMLEIGFSVTTSVTSLLHVIHCVTWLRDVVDSDASRKRRGVTCCWVLLAWVVSIVVLTTLHLVGSKTYKEESTLLCWLEVTPAYERLILVVSFLPQAALVVVGSSVVVGYYFVKVKGERVGQGRDNFDRLHRHSSSYRKNAADCEDSRPHFLARVHQRSSGRHSEGDGAIAKIVGKNHAIPSAPPVEMDESIKRPHAADPEIASQASSCAKDLYRISTSDEDEISVTSENKREYEQTFSHEVVVEETTHVSTMGKTDADLTLRKMPEERACSGPVDDDHDVKTTHDQDLLYGSSPEELYVDAVDECYPTALLKTYADEGVKGFSRESALKSKPRPIADDLNPLDRGGTVGDDRDADSTCSFHSCDPDAGLFVDQSGLHTSPRRTAKRNARRSIDDVIETESLGDWKTNGSHVKRGQGKTPYLGSDRKALPATCLLEDHRRLRKEHGKAGFPADVVAGCLLVLICFLPFFLSSVEGWACFEDCQKLYLPQTMVLGLFDSYFALLPAVWLLCPRVRAAFRPKMNCGSGCNVVTGL